MNSRSMRSVLASYPATLLPTLRSCAMRGTLLCTALAAAGCGTNTGAETSNSTNRETGQLLAALKADREQQSQEAAALRAAVERANIEIKSLRAEIEKSRAALADAYEEMQTADENERRLRSFYAHIGAVQMRQQMMEERSASEQELKRQINALREKQFHAATQPSNQ